MSEPTPGTIELTCPGCQAYFRLKPKKGKFPKGPIPCPKCQTSIPLNIPKSDASSTDAPSSTPQSGVLSRSKIRKGPSTSPMQRSVPAMTSEKKPRETKEQVDDAFLRAADQLLDHPNKSPTSTFQGFGIAENLRRTSPQQALNDTQNADDSPSVKKNSTTDTSLFHREDPTKALNPQVIQQIKAAHQHDTPVGGIDVMSTQTPVGGVNPLSNPLDDLTLADENEPGPFDMRDILEAERSKLEGSDPNEVTHNPLLDGQNVFASPKQSEHKPLPSDQLGAEVSLGATATVADDTASAVANSEPPIIDTPLTSRSDIFTDASASAPSEPTQEMEMPGASDSSPKADSSPSKSSKPLAAMLRKKFGAQKLDTLRTTLNEPSTPIAEGSSTPAIEPDKAPKFKLGADEDDLAKILDEADSKRPSGEHQMLSQRDLGPHMHPTKPALHVNQELSKRLANIMPPSLNGDSDLIEDPEPAPPSTSIGARFKKRLQQDRSPDLEPGKPPAVKGSSLLAKLKPNRVPASEITGEIPIARHLQSPQGLPDEASVPADDAKSGSFNRFDLTPQRGDDTPKGISWATSDSIAASSAAFQDHAQHVTRKRRRQESHSGLFPISGGLGQEDSLGFANERKGSGYIRLPTSEIIDVLGKGQYRLLVEDIVYEPVDERGLTELVKRGVILGAEKIADADGEWRPINEHPVFRRLKKKMAIEAHALLAKYRQPSSGPSSVMEEDSEDISVPPISVPGEDAKPSDDIKTTDNTLKVKDFSNPTPSVIERLDDLSAELDEDSAPEATGAPPTLPATAQLHAVKPPEHAERDDISEAIEQTVQESEHDVHDMPEESEASEEPEALKAPPTSLDEESSVVYGAPTFEGEDPLSEKKRSPWLPIAGLLLVGGLIVAGVLFTQPELRQQLFGSDSPIVDEPIVNKDGSITPPPTGAPSITTAITQARSAIQSAVSMDLTDRTKQLELAKSFGTQGEHTLANTLYAMAWTPSADGAVTQNYADSLIAAKDYAQLRQLAMTGLASGEQTDLYEGLRQQALDKDDSLRALTFIEINRTSHGDSMTLVNSDRGLVFKLVDAQGQAWAFHPEQKDYTRSAWHRDMTAWRLCQLIVCGIHIPEVSPSTMSAEVFDHLMSAQGSGAAAPSDRYASLEWQGKGPERSISGALKRWEEPGAFWPFPYTNTWRPWLAAYEDAALMDKPLGDALTNMQRSDVELYDAMLAQNPGMTTRELAEQLTHAITFDFLTNNMNRFKERIVYNGARDNQLSAGRFHSLDHSTVMNSRLSSRVKGRFDWVQRFDRAMIDSIRALDPERSAAILFPEGSEVSRGEQQAFWSRREKLLKEVDARAVKYGKENVLYFE